MDRSVSWHEKLPQPLVERVEMTYFDRVRKLSQLRLEIALPSVKFDRQNIGKNLDAFSMPIRSLITRPDRPFILILEQQRIGFRFHHFPNNDTVRRNYNDSQRILILRTD